MAESASEAVRAEYERDPAILVWWATEVECASAVARQEREGALTARVRREAFERLDSLAAAWSEIQPAGAVRRAARRLLRLHNLRAANSLQLAAALLGSEGDPATLTIVSLDDRLVDAAEREGFSVEPA